jgi:hypothetical protein
MGEKVEGNRGMRRGSRSKGGGKNSIRGKKVNKMKKKKKKKKKKKRHGKWGRSY